MEIKLLKEFLNYDPTTGIMRWIKSPAPRIKIGEEAGKSDGWRYARVQLKGKNMLAHRVCWAIYYGYWPKHIDHLNGNGFDNRIVNLRSVSAFENCKNKLMHRNGKKFGAHFVRGKWHSTIRVNGKSVHLGVFGTEAEAFACTFGYIKGANLKKHLGG